MGWLGRALGKQPPRVPAGGRAFTSVKYDADGRATWAVRVQMPGEDQTSSCKRLSPVFDQMMDADRYLDWIEGGPVFTYPPGSA